MDKELRVFQVEQLEVRAATDDEPPVIRGYAAVFNQLSDDLGGFREKIRPGAFATSIKQNDVRALWNHDSNYVLGRNTASTLFLEEDAAGLRVQIMPPETQWASDLIVSMQRGDVDQMSFGFMTRADDWQQTDGGTVRELLDVDLFDVSIVTFPAYPQTSAEARAKAESIVTAGAGGDEQAETDAAAQERARRARLRLAESIGR